MNKIEHIGIAVTNLATAGPLYEKLLNTTVYKVEEVASEKVKTAFLQNGPNKIELLEATDEDSPIAKFITKKGEGIHHVAFAVDDIYAEMARLKAEGFVLLNEEPKRGADNKLVCFVHPKSAGGVLVELCEDLKKNYVLAKYNVKFFKKLFFDQYFDSMDSDNSVLNLFLTDFRTPDEVSDVIFYINAVLIGTNEKELLGSESLAWIVVEKDKSKFYADIEEVETSQPEFTMPTSDFKKIAEEWMFYIRSNQLK